MAELANIIRILNIPSQSRSYEDISLVMNLTQEIAFFKNISESRNSSEIHRNCCQFMTVEHFEANEMIVEFGTIGYTFYIILDGSVGIHVPTEKTFTQEEAISISEKEERSKDEEKIVEALRENGEASEFTISVFVEVGTLKKGLAFGERSLDTDRPRAATVIAKEPVTVAVLTKPDYEKLVSEFLKKEKNAKLDFFKSLPLFEKWSKLNLSKVSYYFKKKGFFKNQKVYSEGMVANQVFFVLEGVFLLTKNIMSESVGILERNSFTLKNYSEAAKVSLKLKNAKKLGRYAKCSMVQKGKFEMIGAEEIFEDKKTREYTCECISFTGTLFAINRDHFITRVIHPDSLTFLNSTKDNIVKSYRKRIKDFEKIEEAKKYGFETPTTHKLLQRNSPVVQKYRISPSNTGREKKKSLTPSFNRVKTNEELMKISLLSESKNELVQFVQRYNKRLFERRPIQKQIVRKLAPPNYLLSVRRGVNHPQTRYFNTSLEDIINN